MYENFMRMLSFVPYYCEFVTERSKLPFGQESFALLQQFSGFVGAKGLLLVIC